MTEGEARSLTSDRDARDDCVSRDVELERSSGVHAAAGELPAVSNMEDPLLPRDSPSGDGVASVSEGNVAASSCAEPPSTAAFAPPPPPKASMRSYLRMWVSWIACVICGGILPGQALFTQQFAEAGIYRELCSSATELAAQVNLQLTTSGESSLVQSATAARTRRLDVAAANGHNSTASTTHRRHLSASVPTHAAAPGSTTSTCPQQYLTLANVFNVLQCVAIAAFLPAGLTFDCMGGRWTGVAGAAMLIVGLSILSIAVSLVDGGAVPSSSETAGGLTPSSASFFSSQTLVSNLLFPLGVLISDFGSLVNSYCLLAFLFHLPGYNGLLLALANCAYYVSAFLPSIVDRAIESRAFGVSSFAEALALFACAVAVSAVVLRSVVPTQDEYFKQAQVVLGVPLPKPRFQSWGQMKTTFRLTWKALRVELFTEHVHVLLACLLANMACFVYNSVPAPFGAALFGSASAGRALAEVVAFNIGVMGLVLGPSSGVILDRVGLAALVLAQSCAMLIVAVFCSVADWTVQEVVVTAVNSFLVTNTLGLQRYVICYSAPNRIGTMTGVFTCLFATVAVPLSFAMTALMRALGGAQPLAGADDHVSAAVGVDEGGGRRAAVDDGIGAVGGGRNHAVVDGRGESSVGPGAGHESAQQVAGPGADDVRTTIVWAYAGPTIAFAVCAAASLAFLARRLRKNLPSSPPLLPEDELELSRRFMVGTLEDASIVLGGIPKQELLRLSASSNVFEMRKLTELMAGSVGRLRELAIRKVQEAASSADAGAVVDVSEMGGSSGVAGARRGERPRYSASLGEGFRVADRTASLEVASVLLADAFWPPHGASYSGSPMMTWFSGGYAQRPDLQALTGGHDVAPSTDFAALAASCSKDQLVALALIEANEFQQAMGYHTSCGFGHILELRYSAVDRETDTSTSARGEKRCGAAQPGEAGSWSEDEVCAVCLCLPPGVYAKVGSEAYYYAMANNDTAFPALMGVCPDLMLRHTTLEACMDEHRAEQPPHWYVQQLGTAGSWRGRGCAPKLLDVVHGWAKRDGCCVYLETDIVTSRFYIGKMGYRLVWKETLRTSESESSCTFCGLVYTP